MTRAQRRALETASHRSRRNFCPMWGVHAAAETALLNALKRRGWCTQEPIPCITDAGLAALAAADRESGV